MIEREGKERKPIRSFLGVSLTADLLENVREAARVAKLSVSGYVQQALRRELSRPGKKERGK